MEEEERESEKVENRRYYKEDSDGESEKQFVERVQRQFISRTIEEEEKELGKGIQE